MDHETFEINLPNQGSEERKAYDLLDLSESLNSSMTDRIKEWLDLYSAIKLDQISIEIRVQLDLKARFLSRFT